MLESSLQLRKKYHQFHYPTISPIYYIVVSIVFSIIPTEPNAP